MITTTLPASTQAQVERFADVLFHRYWTEDAYLTLSEISPYQIELASGRLSFLEMPSVLHRKIVLNIATAMQTWARENDAGTVLTAPLPVRLWPEKFREPDVLFIRKANEDRIGEQYVSGPDLVVEVLSPRTASDDLGAKKDEYAKAGIPEYWIVNPQERDIRIYTLKDAAYDLTATVGADAMCKSATVPGLSIGASDLFSGV